LIWEVVFDPGKITVIAVLAFQKKKNPVESEAR
jgi:hypothetical protein